VVSEDYEEPLEAFREVERKFWDRHRSETERVGDTEFKKVFSELLPKIRRYTLERRESPEVFQERLREADRMFADLRYALMANVDDPPAVLLWYYPDLSCIQMRGPKLTECSPVDPRSLESAAVGYLARPWMQTDFVDWCILNGFIFDEAARHADGVRAGAVSGDIDWAYAFAAGDPEKQVFHRAWLVVAKFIARWLALPLAAFMLIQRGFTTAAQLVALIYAMYLAFVLVTLPWRISSHRERKRKSEKYELMMYRLIVIFSHVRHESIHPTRLKRQIEKAEDEDSLILNPVVHTLLDLAIERNPISLTTRTNPQ